MHIFTSARSRSIIVLALITAAVVVFAVHEPTPPTQAMPPPAVFVPPPPPAFVAPPPVELAVTSYITESSTSHIYWTQASYESTGVIAHLMRAPITGGTPQLVADDASFGFVIAGEWIYYVSSPQPAIRKVALDGSANELVALSPSEPYDIAAGGGFVYWTSTHGVMRAPTDGGAAVKLRVGRAQDALAVDDEYLYIAGRTLQRIAHGTTKPTTLARFGAQATGIVAAEHHLVVTVDNKVVRIARDGGAPQTLATGGIAHRLTRTGDAVYWTTWGDERAQVSGCSGFDAGTVRRLDAELATVEDLASGCSLRGFTASSAASFFIEHSRMERRAPRCTDAAHRARHDDYAYRIEGGESPTDAARGAEATHAAVLERCTESP